VEYIETTGGAFSFAASSNNEFDLAIQQGSGHSQVQIYYFRAVMKELEGGSCGETILI